MSTVVPPSSMSSRTLEALSEVPSCDSPPVVSPDIPSACQYYKIEGKRYSECALVLFTRHMFTSEQVVMKVLREYKDTRFSLGTLGERQQCQLEALQRNRVFTPEVYIGLARICDIDLSQESISIGEVISNPTKAMLDANAEYALLMHQLPEDRRLDQLLKEEKDASLWRYVRLLTKYVARVHTDIAPASREDGVRWGSYEQLQEKLLHNFGLFDPLLTTSEDGQYSSDDWLKETLVRLEESLLHVLLQDQYFCYFEQRVREQHIKCCHGDLKSLNIWMLSIDHSCEPAHCVKILDTIDFNPMYSMIDTLSDFAMLVIDVQTRRKSAALANEMIEYYLELTEQKDEVARSVLDYYLVEKALVGAAISMVYDNLPELGRSLLEVAEMRLQCLVDRQALDHARV